MKKFWETFDSLMKKVGGLYVDVDDLVNTATSSKFDLGDRGVVVIINNGEIDIKGHIESLKINGYTVRVPDYVLKQVLKPRSCRKCKSTLNIFLYTGTNPSGVGHFFYVGCEKCREKSESCLSPENAEKLWNTMKG